MTDAAVLTDVGRWLEDYAGRVDLGRVLCDDHIDGDGVALVYDGPGGATQTISYRELSERSGRFAGGLAELGVERGDHVSVLLPKSPELIVALVGLWRLGGVHVPLFTAFGPEAVDYRVEHSGSRVVVTNGENLDKLAGGCATARDVICVAAASSSGHRLHDFDELLERSTPAPPRELDGEDLLILLYTSGTTGHPKGVKLPVRALAFIRAYMEHSLDVRPDDHFWNIADPGWGYGLWFAVIGPLLQGNTTLLRGVPFEADDVYEALLRHGITNLTAAPTAYRSLRAAGAPEGFADACRLRAASSAGEPLNPELLEWSRRALGVPIHDHFGQSELGMPIGHHHHPTVHCGPQPGSMGVAAPGFRAVVLDEDGEEVVDEDGELAIDVDRSPLYCFRGYYDDPERTAERFRRGKRYHLTGDTVRLGSDGLFRFASRADDVILSAGYRIGPFEIENVIIAHPAVAEVAVIGVPDELRGESIAAVVVPAADVEADTQLADELKALVKGRLAAHLYPRHVRFVDALPRTHSGKVQRNVLREQWRADG